MPTENTHHIISQWWAELEDKRGERAQLRHCKNLEEIFFVPYYQKLYWQLSNREWKNRVAVAAIAGLLAHVKNSDTQLKLAEQMAQPKGDKPIVSELRFRRLLKCETHREVYPTLMRIIHLLNDTANLTYLANSVYWWNNQTRREWAFQYYEKL